MTAEETSAQSYSQAEAAKTAGIWHVHFARGLELGLIPTADADGERWSAAAVEELAARAQELTEQIAAHQPLGATRIAAALAERTGTEVTPADMEELAERGLLEVIDYYKKWPLYDPVGLFRSSGNVCRSGWGTPRSGATAYRRIPVTPRSSSRTRRRCCCDLPQGAGSGSTSVCGYSGAFPVVVNTPALSEPRAFPKLVANRYPCSSTYSTPWPPPTSPPKPSPTSSNSARRGCRPA